MGRGPHGGLYVGATVLAIFAPNAAAGFYLVIALVTVARARGDSPSPEPGGQPGRLSRPRQQNSLSLPPGRRVSVPPSSSS